ncbi:ribosome silencing factor [Puniceibacterium sp. IMCC21224]|uniref:ribosome silencing factor n=1 Tax=Puniceibacterium sp. IMCC21224 TaxID=1618204 RepID=UPI00065D0120|nr:ribosome silencing factor [Puniceibacterium sp. IMCC21224]KMK66399.1 ribosome silencing factor RsfS/YbeB/iojap [Puniceibacterium sp. IMCC21224]
MLCLTTPSVGALTARATKEDDVLSATADAAMAAVRGMPMTGVTHMDVTSDMILASVLESLDDNKAEEVVQIDLRGKTAIGDHMVVCSGRSSRQVAAIADKVAEDLKQRHGILSKTEGKETGDWVLIDTGDVIVHVFRPEVREFYQLEKMWLPSGMAPQSKPQ